MRNSASSLPSTASQGIRPSRWLAHLGRGVGWSAIYNGVWGAAWFGFMKDEWVEASAATGQAMPWTADFWLIWIPLTIPFGVAISAYASDPERRHRARRAAMSAAICLWIPSTIGMAAWATRSPRIIVVDSLVNLVALFLASLAVALLLPSQEH